MKRDWAEQRCYDLAICKRRKEHVHTCSCVIKQHKTQTQTITLLFVSSISSLTHLLVLLSLSPSNLFPILIHLFILLPWPTLLLLLAVVCVAVFSMIAGKSNSHPYQQKTGSYSVTNKLFYEEGNRHQQHVTSHASTCSQSNSPIVPRPRTFFEDPFSFG